MKQILITGCSRSGHNFVADQIDYWNQDRKYEIIRSDDYHPKLHGRKAIDLYKYGIPADEKKGIVAIWILRGFTNWLASYMMWITDKGTRPISETNLAQAIDTWKEHVRAYQFTKGIQGAVNIFIKYEDFTFHPEARKKTAGHLGLPWYDDRIHIRSTQGRGSSFEYWIQVGARSETQQRYKKVHPQILDQLYRDVLINSKDAVELYKDNWTIPREERTYIDNLLAI